MEKDSSTSTELTERKDSSSLPRHMSLFDTTRARPTVNYSYKQATLKGEDKALVATNLKIPGSKGLRCHVFAVFDGHNGVSTAKYCKDNLLDELLPRVPKISMPAETDKAQFQAYMDQLQKAMMDTFLALNRKSIATECASGCTASVMLVTGWLVTVANVGDSAVMIDTHTEVKELTSCHRLNDNPVEVERLRKAGYLVAALRADLQGPAENGEPGYGPLRAWPGGIMMARAIGDGDAGVTVLAYPHVTQVKVPDTGARLILASDGVWDSKLTERKVIKITRQNRLSRAAPEVVRRAVAISGLVDDTTAMCVDILPQGVEDFSAEQGTLNFCCFSNPKAAVEDEEDSSVHTYCIVNMAETVPEEYLAEAHAVPEGVFAKNRIYSVKRCSVEVPPELQGPALSAMASVAGLSVYNPSVVASVPLVAQRASGAPTVGSLTEDEPLTVRNVEADISVS